MSPWGFVVLYGPDAFALSVGLPGDDDPHPGRGVRTLYLHPFADREPEYLRYCYNPGLVVGGAKRVLATVIKCWNALDRKQDMSGSKHPGMITIRTAAGANGTWRYFDPASDDWGSRPAMAGLWPEASRLWPVCERGWLSAVLPPGQLWPPY